MDARAQIKDPEEIQKRECLARYICRFRMAEKRREFLDKLETLHGPIFAEDMRERVRREWERQRNNTHMTQPEQGAQKLINAEHAAQKCLRCKGRYDLSDGRFICSWGFNSGEVLKSPQPCRRFKLETDRGRWRDA